MTVLVRNLSFSEAFLNFSTTRLRLRSLKISLENDLTMAFSVAETEVEEEEEAAAAAVENVLRKRRDKADIVFGLWRGQGSGSRSEKATVVWFVGFKMSPYDSCMTCRSTCTWKNLSFRKFRPKPCTHRRLILRKPNWYSYSVLIFLFYFILFSDITVF